MKVSIILVGTELLNGGVVDTNSTYMAEELNKYGIKIKFKVVVGDKKSEICNAIDFCRKNSDLIIISGGLGPTLDDVTKEAVSEYLGKPLIIDEKELLELKEKFEKAGIEFKDLNLKEVEKPKGAKSFKNNVGMAPSIYIDDIVAFPGVPKELSDMFPKFLNWYVNEKKLLPDEIYIKDIITFGLAESILDATVREFFTENNIQYEFLIKDYGTLIRLQTSVKYKNKAKKIVEQIYDKIEEFIFGEDEDRLEIKVVNLLKDKKNTLSTAESCTGGMIASKIVSVPGASSIFYEGVVCYTEESKIKRLNVKQETLKKFTVVSQEVVEEMLEGLNTDIRIATTGIAGPNGGTGDKPVGLVYIGIKVGEKSYIDKKIFEGSREDVRKKATLQALFNLIKILEGKI